MNINIPMDKLKELAGYGLLLGAVSLVGYVIKAAHNMNAVADKVGKSVDEICRSTPVNISASMVNEAVRQIVEKESYSIIQRASVSAVNAVSDDIRKEVKAAVDTAYPSVKDAASDKLEQAISKLDMESAVNQAAVRFAEKKIGEIRKTAVSAVQDDILKETRAAVDKAYPDVKEAVQRELKRKAEQVSLEAIKSEVIAEVKETASEKMDDALDDILEEFNGNLKNISKIYKSIANAITGSDD